jgi:ABC-type branched-subunit amino acid transport system substrate-binding protein/predicted negative regulator of RcsB-dependent stress response
MVHTALAPTSVPARRLALPLVPVALVLVALLLGLTGCPRGTRKTLVPELPSSGDPEAKDRFVSARASFLRDGGNGEELAAIAHDFPDDPIAPFAQLYAGQAFVKARDYAAAEAPLREVAQGDADERLRLRAQLFLGLALNYRGDHAAALPLLRKGEKATDGDAERGEFLAAMAEAQAAGELPLVALPAYDQWYRMATPIERSYIATRVDQLVAAAGDVAVREAWDAVEDDKGPSKASLILRVAARREGEGKLEEARELREQAVGLRARLGLPSVVVATAASASAPGLVGAILPLGGKQNRVGEAAALGLSLAAGAGDGKGSVIVEVRSAQNADEASSAFEELSRANAVAVIGPVEGAAVDAVAARAGAAGLSLLSLASRPEERASGRFVFHVMHSAEARARALARRAHARGVRKFAVLAPDSGYGRAVSDAFTAELARLGATVVTTQTYPADTRSFASVAKKLSGSWQAVFVPEQSDKLELIAPALAAAGLVPRPYGEKKAPGGRPILLMSTAEGLKDGFANDAGRNSLGAMLAPGFYPDAADPVAHLFVERFTLAHGHAPGAIDAYAFDAAQLVAATGAGSRGQVADGLPGMRLAGVTGELAFDANHRRSDDGVIYTVMPADDGSGFQIRVLSE